MSNEIEKNPETKDPSEVAGDLYQEYVLKVKEEWKQEWADELEEQGRKSTAQKAQNLAYFYAREGGDPHQVVFYLEKTNLPEDKKWETLAENFEARANYAFANIDDKREKMARTKGRRTDLNVKALSKEIVFLEERIKYYRQNAKLLRQGAETAS